VDADHYTDASQYALGAVLIQGGQSVAVASRKLSPAETRYSATDREHLELVFAAEKFRLILHQSHAFTRVWSDHSALVTRKPDKLTPRQARWNTDAAREAGRKWRMQDKANYMIKQSSNPRSGPQVESSALRHPRFATRHDNSHARRTFTEQMRFWLRLWSRNAAKLAGENEQSSIWADDGGGNHMLAYSQSSHSSPHVQTVQ